jgi:uncharacterized integral membrane protein (TIGR02327 family)
MIDPIAFAIVRFVLFFPVTYAVYYHLQALEWNKLFKPNSSNAIRFLFMIVAVVLGYLFVDVFVSLIEYVNTIFA